MKSSSRARSFVSRLAGRLVKGFALLAWESVLAVVLVVVFSLLFMGTMLLLFPRGTGLVDFYGDLLAKEGSGRHRKMWASPTDEEPAEIVAVLSRVTRRVKDRPSGAIEWSAARAGLPIQDRHAIQTLARSSAVITIEGKDDLRLAENTLAIFSRSDRERAATRRASLVLLGGRIEGSIKSAAEGGIPLQLVSAGTTTEIRQEGAGPAEFTMTLNPDKSSTLSVYSGTAQITAAGRTAVLETNQSITVEESKAPGAPERIPDPPRPVSPPDRHETTYGSAAPRIELRWDRGRDAAKYRVEISQDPEFEDVLVDETVADTRFVHGNLKSGRYFWRVRSVRGHSQSVPATVREMRLVQDLLPPSLSVELPEEILGEQLVVRGVAEPGSEVLIGDEFVEVSAKGEFRHVVTLSPGMNMVVVEAVDAAGNSAYQAQYVNARF